MYSDDRGTVDNDTRNILTNADLQWLFLALSGAALAFGRSWARVLPLSLVLASGAVLNALAYLPPVRGLRRPASLYANAVQVTVDLTVVSLAAGFSGGVTSPVYPAFFLALLVTAVSGSLRMALLESCYAAGSLALAGALLGNPLGPGPDAFVRLAMLPVLTVSANLLFHASRRRQRDRGIYRSLFEISRSLGESLDLKDVLRRLLKEVDAVFRTDISSVRLLNPGTNMLVVRVSGADSEEVSEEEIEIGLDEGFIGAVARSGQPFITRDISRDPRYAVFPRARKKVASAIAAPISIAGRTIGVVTCASSSRRRFRAEDLDLLEAAAGLAGTAIERADLYQQMLSRGEAVLESMADGLLVVDRDCRVAVSNRSVRAMLEVRPGANEPLEALAKGRVTGWRRFARDVRNLILDSEAGARPSRSAEFRTEEGKLLRADATPVVSQWGRVVGAVITLEDVTETVRLNSELASEKARLEAVLENVVVGIVAADSGGDVLFANSAAFHLLSARRPWWWLGASLEETITEPRLAGIVRRHLESAGELFGEPVVLSSGRRLEVSCVPLREVSGEAPGILAVFHDVTEAHRLEEAKNDFVSMVSHELRMPLTAIKAYVDTLQRQDVEFDEESRGNFIAIIARETDRMIKLIDELLDLQRMESGRLEVDPRPVDLGALIRDIVERIQPQYPDNTIATDISPEMGPVMAEADKMEQVMLNVLSNAVKFSAPGSPLRVRARPLGHKAMVSVADHGVGIPADQLPHIFDKYHRVPGGSGAGGSGLGLYVARTIVEAHGGRVWAESGEGEGTTVMFTVPLAEGSGAGREGPGPA